MAYFFIALAALVLGYFTYGKFVDNLFQPDATRCTPATALEDGVDYVPMKPWKIFLVQLLNIAGLGPIFGPILGALYGPSALIWVVLGTIFAGAVHDYFSGMLSIRNRGESIPDVVGYELGNAFKQFMRGFSIVLLLLVGVVFVLGPAKLLSQLSGMATPYWVAIVFVYYFVATLLPIDKIIGRLYPVFGAILLFMAIGLTVGIMSQGYDIIPTFTLDNLHPKGLPLWPLMFITIACGAISGFHSTQSPLMARCVTCEDQGRPVFYGAMVGEGIIALIWVMLGLSFYHGSADLQAALAKGGPAGVVHDISTTLLGTGFGGILAILGVVVLPITSGDTAFRSARLIVADFLKLSQKEPVKRLYISIPLFVVGFIITKLEFGVIWRYFGWANQTLAAVVLWTAAAYMIKRGKLHWIATIPATFMTAVTITYIAYEKIGFQLDLQIATWLGVACAAGALVWFFITFTPSRIKQMSVTD